MQSDEVYKDRFEHSAFGKSANTVTTVVVIVFIIGLLGGFIFLYFGGYLIPK